MQIDAFRPTLLIRKCWAGRPALPFFEKLVSWGSANVGVGDRYTRKKGTESDKNCPPVRERYDAGGEERYVCARAERGSDGNNKDLSGTPIS